MLRVIVALLAFGWALAGWRNAPRLEHPQSSAFGLMIAASVVFAYWLGRRRSRESAIAIATARAEATAMASVSSDNRSQAAVYVNVNPATGAHRAGSVTGLQAAPWLVDAEVRRDELVSAETDFDDSVMAEFAEDHET